MDGVRLIKAGERAEGTATPGMVRQEAIATDHLWAGMALTEPGMVSGWHHHGDYETAIYVASGAVRMEFGEAGRESLDGEQGDFLYVGPGVVHRESNPTTETSEVLVVRAGSGPQVFNVDAPPGT